MPQPSTFILDGVCFEVARLPPADACAGVELMSRTFGPALAAAMAEQVDMGRLVGALTENASKMAKLLDLFTPHAKVSRAPDGASFAAGNPLVPLAPFAGDVFAGRFELLMAFVLSASRAEYSSFLGALFDGRLAAMLGLQAPKS